MKKFPSIQSFTQQVIRLKSYAAYLGVPVETLPPITYRGTVKLHGTNAGVRVNVNGTVQSQARNEILHDLNPHYGFRDFVTKEEASWRTITRHILSQNNINTQTEVVTIYGEWCGIGVQKGGGIGLAQCPKHFVIFSVFHGDQMLPDIALPDVTSPTIKLLLECLNDRGIYWITQIPTYEVTLDPTNFQAASDYLNTITVAVETECPWAKGMFGVSGTGEGIVWVPTSGAEDERAWFKTKGDKHKVRNSPTGNVAPVDVEKVNSIKECVEIVLTENRMIQMVQDNKLPFEPTSIGTFLKVVCDDIIKEESDVIAQNGLEWKEVGKLVQSIARTWFLAEIQRNTFGK